MNRLILLTISVMFLTAGGLTAEAQPREKTIDIKIYLVDRFESNGTATVGDLFAVKRKINASEPLTGAIASLIDGPTDDELNTLKLYPTIEHIDLISVKPKGKTIWINITAWDLNLIDAAHVRMFRAAASRTLRQFKPLRKVEICLSGIANYDRRSRKTPIRKCSLY